MSMIMSAPPPARPSASPRCSTAAGRDGARPATGARRLAAPGRRRWRRPSTGPTPRSAPRCASGWSPRRGAPVPAPRCRPRPRTGSRPQRRPPGQAGRRGRRRRRRRVRCRRRRGQQPRAARRLALRPQAPDRVRPAGAGPGDLDRGRELLEQADARLGEAERLAAARSASRRDPADRVATLDRHGAPPPQGGATTCTDAYRETGDAEPLRLLRGSPTSSRSGSTT